MGQEHVAALSFTSSSRPSDEHAPSCNSIAYFALLAWPAATHTPYRAPGPCVHGIVREHGGGTAELAHGSSSSLLATYASRLSPTRHRIVRRTYPLDAMHVYVHHVLEQHATLPVSPPFPYGDVPLHAVIVCLIDNAAGADGTVYQHAYAAGM